MSDGGRRWWTLVRLFDTDQQWGPWTVWPEGERGWIPGPGQAEVVEVVPAHELEQARADLDALVGPASDTRRKQYEAIRRLQAELEQALEALKQHKVFLERWENAHAGTLAAAAFDLRTHEDVDLQAIGVDLRLISEDMQMCVAALASGAVPAGDGGA